MCGLAGWIGAAHPDSLQKMIHCLHTRGPDAQGFYSQNNIHFGHARLKIIDLQNGTQPMVSHKSILIFNGEIYNYRELREELKQENINCYTESDTEVLQKALEHWSKKALSKIRGMFALAFYDLENKKLLLARDSTGQKPLFYSFVNNTFLFASTCQSLRQHALVGKELNRAALAHYLINESPKDPDTIYRDIRSVESGSWVSFQLGEITIGSFWQWPHNRQSLSEKKCQQSFSELFQQSVKRRLISDVPLGIFLSGGIDSSSVAWQANELLGNQGLKTFSIGFNEKSYDESNYIHLIAKQLGSEHHHEVLSERKLLKILPKALESCDQPLADGSLLPFYLLCQMTRRHVTVSLSGDGADDVMSGYDPFKAQALSEFSFLLPEFISKPLRSFFEGASPQKNNLPWTFKAKQFLRGFRYRGGEAAAHWMSAWPPESIKELLLDEPLPKNLWKRQDSDDYFDMIAYFRSRYMRDQILTKVDRASMAHSLEVRSPFLDQDLIEFLSRLPKEQIDNKTPLRTWAKGKLPKEILHRRKKGFGMPIAQWLKGPLKEWVEDTVTIAQLKDLGISHRVALALKDRHLNGEADHRKELWTLAVLCYWARTR